MAHETLLIIEAKHDLAEVLRTYFSARGYTVWVAAAGAKGVQLALSELPDLIILDDTLPDLPAEEVIDALRTDATTAHIRFILLRNTAERTDRIAGLMADGDETITMPFDLEEVRLRVQNALAPTRRAREVSEREEALAEPEAAELPPLDDFLHLPDDAKKSESSGEDILPATPPAAKPAPRPITPPAAPSAPAPMQPQAPSPAPYVPPPAPITPAPSRESPLTESSRASGTTPTGGATPDTKSIQFGAYHPREIVPNEWKSLIAYVYYASAEADVQADAGKQLGPLLSGFRKLTQAAKGLINEGANITATPYLPGFQFNPPSVSVAFYENWHRFDFKLRAKDAPLHQAANGMMTFTVEGIIVGDVPLSIFVTEKEQDGPTQQASSQIYDIVFCSYSRKDIQIVERVEKAYKALGMEYLRDMTTLRSGEEWSDELKALITRANIFQLFWSPASSVSNHVRMEWEHALTVSAERPGFIRPVYWIQPIPAVPTTLSHLHFAYQPDLVD